MTQNERYKSTQPAAEDEDHENSLRVIHQLLPLVSPECLRYVFEEIAETKTEALKRLGDLGQKASQGNENHKEYLKCAETINADLASRRPFYVKILTALDIKNNWDVETVGTYAKVGLAREVLLKDSQAADGVLVDFSV